MKNILVIGGGGYVGTALVDQLIEKKLQWKPTYSLKEGLRLTYEWIEKQI